MSEANESSTVSEANESSTVSEVETVASGEAAGESEATEASKPLLRVVKGDLTAEELAALVAVVAARGSAGAPPKKRPRSEWGHPARAVRGIHRPGTDAWRRSAWA